MVARFGGAAQLQPSVEVGPRRGTPFLGNETLKSRSSLLEWVVRRKAHGVGWETLDGADAAILVADTARSQRYYGYKTHF
jgi:hypothetical protein